MRLEINYKKKKVKNTNTWRPNNMLLNNQEITEKIRGNQKNIEKNNNNNTTTQNLWDTARAVLRGKLTTIPSYQEKQEKSQTI